MNQKEGRRKEVWVHPALFSSPNLPVKKRHFLVGRMGSASNLVQLSISGSVQVLNPLRASDQSIELAVGQNHYCFDLNEAGRVRLPNASFRWSFRPIGGTFGVFMDFDASFTNISLPFRHASVFPVELKFGSKQVIGAFQLVQSKTNAAQAVLGP